MKKLFFSILSISVLFICGELNAQILPIGGGSNVNNILNGLIDPLDSSLNLSRLKVEEIEVEKLSLLKGELWLDRNLEVLGDGDFKGDLNIGGVLEIAGQVFLIREFADFGGPGVLTLGSDQRIVYSSLLEMIKDQDLTLGNLKVNSLISDSISIPEGSLNIGRQLRVNEDASITGAMEIGKELRVGEDVYFIGFDRSGDIPSILTIAEDGKVIPREITQIFESLDLDSLDVDYLKVNKEAIFRNAVAMDQSLSVEEDLSVNGTFRNAGSTELLGDVFVRQTGVNIEGPSVLTIAEGTGKLIPTGLPELLNPTPEEPEACLTGGQFADQPASWRYLNNMIITNPCTRDPKVGINIDTPTEALEAAGNIFLNKRYTTGLEQKEYSSNALFLGNKNVFLKTHSGTGALHLSTQGNGQNGLWMQSDGKVGIGTNTPSTRLAVAGNARIIGNEGFSGTGNTAKLLIGDSNFFIESTKGENMHFTSSGSQGGMWLSEQNSNLSIGKNLDQQRLSVAGNALFQGEEGFVQHGDSAYIEIGDANHFVKTISGDGMHISTFLNQGIFIKEQGGVGIGTNTPKASLEVQSGEYDNRYFAVKDYNGDDVFAIMKDEEDPINNPARVYARDITVKLGDFPFPDYVFKKDYHLLSLAEVEKHILQYGRLPKMPSAKEVEQQGMDVGEMNRLLVEKVEELTLHLIEMQKEIERLKSEIKKN